MNCLGESHSGRYSLFSRNSSAISCLGGSRETRKGRGHGKAPTAKPQQYSLNINQLGSFGEEHLQGPDPLQGG